MIEIREIMEYTKNLNLLYAEDNEDTRVSTLSILEIMFDNIIVAVDGVDGLDKFKSNTIDIVITDINMPNMNGLEMAHHIKQIEAQIPILIFSAYNEVKYFVDAIKIGVDGYLLKPIDMNQFSSSLKKSVENIKLRKDNAEYKHSLEKKVQKQVDELRDKDKILLQKTRMATMGEMVDAIAHQWKQPLNIISMKSDFVSIYANKDKFIAQEHVDECNKDIKKQVEHLVNTLDEFRNFFRPGKDIKKLNLKTLFRSISLLVQDELIKNQTELEILSLEDIFIAANENDIKHLFINLINNAKDEMIASGIENEDRIITIECSKKDTEIEILVKDNGKGIPEDVVGNIFKANFTTKKDEGGTGVGLYMCKQIIDKYDGKIDVRNNNGAVFTIILKQYQPE